MKKHGNAERHYRVLLLPHRMQRFGEAFFMRLVNIKACCVKGMAHVHIHCGLCTGSVAR